MEMAQLPLASSFQGDFILKLVMVDEDDTMDLVAARTAEHSAGRTVRLLPGVLRVRLQGEAAPYDRAATVRAVGLRALQCIEVYREEEQT
jgi:toluene monooxygenase system protein B